MRSTSTVSTLQADSKPERLLPRLRAQVATLHVGDRLPGERDLSAQWQVSRATVRNCVDTLVAEGLLLRRQGSGTYVTLQPFVRLLGLTSFSRDMRERGLAPGNQLLSFTMVKAHEKLAAKLCVPAQSEVIRFSRLRLADGTPMAVETVAIPRAVVPGLVARDLDASFYELLSAKYEIVVSSAKVTIDPVTPDARSSGLLGIPADQACLRMRMIDLDARNKVIMIANCIYRGDRYQLTADVTGSAFSPKPSRLDS